jgi:hypothetical protein
VPKTLRTLVNEDGKTILVPCWRKYPYSEEVADIILSLISEGYTLRQISKIKTMPALSIIYRWTRTHEKFREALVDAREDMKEVFRDKALEEAEKEGRVSKRTKIKVDTLKWASESVGSGISMGKDGGPVHIHIETGVRREKEVVVPTVSEEIERLRAENEKLREKKDVLRSEDDGKTEVVRVPEVDSPGAGECGETDLP